MGCGTSTDTQPATDQNKNHQNGVLQNSKAPLPAIKTSLKGDYSQFQLSKYQREKQQKERQLRLYIAADICKRMCKCMSDFILCFFHPPSLRNSREGVRRAERLSLGTRSRATSRNTSRTASPTNNKRSAHLSESTNPMTPVIEDRNRSESYRSDGSLNQPLKGAKKQADTSTSKKKGKHKVKKKANKGEKIKTKKHKKGKKSKNKKHISFENEENDSGLEDSGLVIQQSDDSVEELSSDDELVNIIDETADDMNDTYERNSTIGDIGEIKDDKYKSVNTDTSTRDDSAEFVERHVRYGEIQVEDGEEKPLKLVDQTESIGKTENPDGEEKSHDFVEKKEIVDNTKDVDPSKLESTNDSTGIVRPVVSGKSHDDEVIQSEEEHKALVSDEPNQNESMSQENSIDQTRHDPAKGEYNPSEHSFADTVLSKGDASISDSNSETPEIILSNRSVTHIRVHTDDREKT